MTDDMKKQFELMSNNPRKSSFDRVGIQNRLVIDEESDEKIVEKVAKKKLLLPQEKNKLDTLKQLEKQLIDSKY